MRLRVVVSTDRAYRVLKRQDMAPLATQVAGEVRTVVQHCGVQLSVTALVADAPSMARAAATGAGALLLLLLPPPPRLLSAPAPSTAFCMPQQRQMQ